MNPLEIVAFVALALAVAGEAVLIYRARRETHRVRADLTEQIAQFREQRDAAVRAVRWVPVKGKELQELSKTGCGNCHGEGVFGVKNNMNVCFCVIKNVSGRAEYSALENGILVRLATQAELDAILPNERTGNVTPIRRQELTPNVS